MPQFNLALRGLVKKYTPRLIVVSAPSGAGKTTLCKKLLEDFPSLTLSISSTTRKPRGQEKYGVDYFFLSQEEFKRQIDLGLFAEWASVHGNYYGTSKEVIQKAFDSQLSVLLDIDVQGAALLRKVFPDQCTRIFIAPPDLETLKQRLIGRGTDSPETIEKRMVQAKIEIEEGKGFDHLIVNDSLERAYSELKDLLQTQYFFKKKLGSSGNV